MLAGLRDGFTWAFVLFGVSGRDGKQMMVLVWCLWGERMICR